MTANQYLQSLLSSQTVPQAHMDALRRLRMQIEHQLSSGLNGAPRFYYAGSLGKRTMIHQRYDLDIVVYWPSTVTYTIESIYQATGNVLKKNGWIANAKTVSWELPFDGGFHIDVVPGRAMDAQFRYANLYRTDTGTTLQTSLKVHIDTVRNSGRSEAIRLLKLWRERRQVPFKKSFLLELMSIEGCKGVTYGNLDAEVQSALVYIRDNIRRCRVIDPANSNNVLSDDLSATQRDAIYIAANAAANATNWSDVFR